MDKRILSMEAHGGAGWPGPASTRRVAALVLTGVLAVLLHAAILGGLTAAWPGGASPPPRVGSLQVRTLADSPSNAAGLGHAPVQAQAVEPARPDEDRSGLAQVAAPRTGEGRSSPRHVAALRPDEGRSTLPQVAAVPRRDEGRSSPPQLVAPAPARLDTRDAGAPRATARSSGTAPGEDAPRLASGPAPGGAAPHAPAGDPASADAATAGVAAPSAAEPVPLYSTRPPPAGTLRYALRLGGSTGEAELRWRPTPERYTLQLEGQVDGGPALRQVSEGGFDVAGLAPLRHTEQRTRRGMLATNFQRESGRISFSGSGLQLALGRGSQDRLSWIVQLAAVLAAEPARRVAGAVVDVPVAGLRGESAVWRFRVAEGEPMPAKPAEPVAVRLVRERQGAYDVEVEVRLDPTRHFMPERVAMRTASGTPALELVLRDAVFEP